MAFRDKTATALRDLLGSQGEDGAVEVIETGLEQKKFNPNDFSLREIWEACQSAAGASTSIHEAVASSAFPKITGALINSRMISAYESVQKIGDMLCTTIPSNVQQETIAGFTETEGPEEVGEGQDYKDSTFTEKYVTIRNQKFGRLISITEETLYFDKVGQILDFARRIGMKAAAYRERAILQGVQDVNSNVWRPSGVATAFFSAGNGNLIASNPFGELGLENVRLYAQRMKDDSIGAGAGGDQDYVYIDLNNMTVLVPSQLELEAWQMANSMLTPESNENARNFFEGRFKPMTSPHVTNQSATTWYAGQPKEDFVWTEVWPLQTLSQAAGHDDSFKKDIKSRHKVRYYGNIGAVDVKHWFKNTA
jgi:hypothetical protein